MNRGSGRISCIIAVAALMVLITPCVRGQTVNEPGAMPGSADDSLGCVDYISWYKAAMNEGNISEALHPGGRRWPDALTFLKNFILTVNCSTGHSLTERASRSTLTP